MKCPFRAFKIYAASKAGGIVREAHQPAYRKAGWRVAAVFDPDRSKAADLARDFNIEKVVHSVDDAVSMADEQTVFDIATPAAEIIHILPAIPDGSVLMIQKPFGSNLEEATRLRELCIQKKLIAAVNFQNRFMPAVAAAKRLIDQGWIGDFASDGDPDEYVYSLAFVELFIYSFPGWRCCITVSITLTSCGTFWEIRNPCMPKQLNILP